VVRVLLVGVCGLLWLSGAPGPSAATIGVVNLHWGACYTGESQVDIPSIPDRHESGPMLWGSVRGHSEPHVAYEIWIAVHDGSSALPDAWQFDAEGCQGTDRISINHLGPAWAIKTCPNFQGYGASLQIKTFQRAPEHLGLPPSVGVIVLANTYPTGSPTATNPNVPYFLVGVVFDLSSAVSGPGFPGETCGGLDTPLCFTVIPARTNVLLADGRLEPFRVGQGTVTTYGGCHPVPADAVTWGAIKGQYRR